jgi:pimeloyl-ACP methyl ester carboxylesterase
MQKVIREISVKTKARGFTRMAVALTIALAWLPLARAAAPDIKCPDGKMADGIERAGSSRYCVVIRKFEPAGASARVLLVFLHGDHGGSVELPVDSGTAFNLSQQLKATTIAVQRPGYRSHLGMSDGTTSAQDDDYTPGNVEILAAALDRLRTLNPGKKILLIGYSGGAAMAALLAGRFPASADAYLLAACPCDVPQWRQWRNALLGQAAHWTHSLSPQGEVGQIKAGTRISLVVGNKDDDTLPKFSEAYVASLQTQGVKTRLTYAVGATHVSVQRSPEFFMLARELAAELSR